MFVCVDVFATERVCVCVRVFSYLLELNVKPISKPLIQLVVEIYCRAANANL